MSLLLNKRVYDPKFGLKSKECIDLVLKPLTDHVTIRSMGLLQVMTYFVLLRVCQLRITLFILSQNIYLDVSYETSLRYHLKKLFMDEFDLTDDPY
jgi:putative transposase